VAGQDGIAQGDDVIFLRDVGREAPGAMAEGGSGFVQGCLGAAGEDDGGTVADQAFRGRCLGRRR